MRPRERPAQPQGPPPPGTLLTSTGWAAAGHEGPELGGEEGFPGTCEALLARPPLTSAGQGVGAGQPTRSSTDTLEPQDSTAHSAHTERGTASYLMRSGNGLSLACVTPKHKKTKILATIPLQIKNKQPSVRKREALGLLLPSRRWEGAPGTHGDGPGPR